MEADTLREYWHFILWNLFIFTHVNDLYHFYINMKPKKKKERHTTGERERLTEVQMQANGNTQLSVFWHHLVVSKCPRTITRRLNWFPWSEFNSGGQTQRYWNHGFPFHSPCVKLQDILRNFPNLASWWRIPRLFFDEWKFLFRVQDAILRALDAVSRGGRSLRELWERKGAAGCVRRGTERQRGGNLLAPPVRLSADLITVASHITPINSVCSSPDEQSADPAFRCPVDKAVISHRRTAILRLPACLPSSPPPFLHTGRLVGPVEWLLHPQNRCEPHREDPPSSASSPAVTARRRRR